MQRAWRLRGTAGRRAALLALLIALHASLLLLPRQVLHRYRQEPLALIYLPQPHASREAAKPAPTRAPARASAVQPITPPIAAAPSEVTQNPPPHIDWDSEVSITVQHQTELANAPKPRSLDDHRGHHHQDGVGLNSHEAPQFGWNETAIHRFDTRGEIPIIRLSDRCILPLGPFIPLPMCGFGKKIEPRGDLFEHLKDTPAPEPPP